MPARRFAILRVYARSFLSACTCTHVCMRVRACCAARGERCPQRGERETGVPDSVTPTVDALSPFFSPLPLPPPFVRLPRSLSLPFLSILRAKRASSPSLYLSFRLTPPPSPSPLFLSVYPEIARSHHGIIRCEVVQRPLSRLDLLAGFISKRDDAW